MADKTIKAETEQEKAKSLPGEAKQPKKDKPKKNKSHFAVIIIAAVLLLAVAGVVVVALLGGFDIVPAEPLDPNFTLKEFVERMNSVNAECSDSYRTDGEIKYENFKPRTDYPEFQGAGGRYKQYVNYVNEDIALVANVDSNGNVAAFAATVNKKKYNDNIYLLLGYERQAARAADDKLTAEKTEKLISDITANMNEKKNYYQTSLHSIGYGFHANVKDIAFYVWCGNDEFGSIGYWVSSESVEATTEPTTVYKPKSVGSSKTSRGGTVTFSSAQAINSDVVGWLGICDTNCTGPVLQTGNNTFYLNHDIYKNYYVHGSRYADFRCNFSGGNLSQNTTIYGHYNDSHRIFADLTKYTDLNFYKNHPVIQFDTKYEQGFWKVFAVFITNTKSSQGKIFEYRDPEFASQEQFLYFIEREKRRSVIDTGVDVQENDRILTLSTCSRLMSECRLVVVARKVRPGENPGVDLNNVKYNPSPLFPNAFYKNSVKAYSPYWYGPKFSSYKKPSYADEK